MYIQGLTKVLVSSLQSIETCPPLLGFSRLGATTPQGSLLQHFKSSPDPLEQVWYPEPPYSPARWTCNYNHLASPGIRFRARVQAVPSAEHSSVYLFAELTLSLKSIHMPFPLESLSIIYYTLLSSIIEGLAAPLYASTCPM
jgi:hypothetical protein